MEVPDILDFEIPKQAGTDVPVSKWSNIACKLYVAGESFHVIANTLALDEDEVKSFVTSPGGQTICRDLITDENQAVKNILRGSKLDTVNMLIQMRDTAQSESVRLSTCKTILDLEAQLQSEQTISPDEAKAEIDKLMKELRQ